MKVTNILILIMVCAAIIACANANEKSPKVSNSQVNEAQVKQVVALDEVSNVKASDNSDVEVNSTQATKEPVRKQIIKSKSDRESIKIVSKDKMTKSTTSKASSESKSAVIEPKASPQKNVIKNEVKTVAGNVKDALKGTKEKRVEKVESKMEAAGIETDKVSKPEKPVRLAQSRPMHKYFDSILKNHVSADGTVDYKGIKSDLDRLNKYITDLENFSPKGDWTNDEKLAYWINAYNAYTIKLIVDNYPLKSITELHNGKPWDHKWINIDGKSLSLNAIENEIIRPTFKEPRIHFAVNCAAKSCPPLMNAAYTKDNLETLLAERTTAFINNEKYNTLTVKPAKISKIFDWYAEDFGDVVTYINKYMQLKQPPIENIVYSEYDWSLNGK